MYYPYLRGKQFELIAIRELLAEGLLSEHITPLIEPVTLSPTLNSTLRLFIDEGHDIALIKNPKVGSFSVDLKKEDKKGYISEHENIINNDNIQDAYICDTKLDYTSKDIQEQLQDSILIIENSDVIDLIHDNRIVGGYYCIPYKSTFKRRIRDNKILLEDKFEKRERNMDYVDIEEEFFSDDHLYYQGEGFSGFSDYSVIGKEYSESGFAPYTVAIHIVYFDEKRQLRVMHFTSTTNHDSTNPAKKYNEAVVELSNWYKDQLSSKGKEYVKNHIQSSALDEFIEHANTGNYSGLGVPKKLSIKHHLELLSRFFEGGLDYE